MENGYELYGVPDNWTLLTEGGWEEEAWTVDRASIYLMPDGRFALATASGCSCWDGDWYVQEYDTIDQVAESAYEDRRWAPSLVGMKRLVEEAYAKLAE